MRRFLVLALLVACGKPAASSGPAWPKSAGWEPVEDWKEDGGESIEPQVPEEVAAVEHGDEPKAEGDADTKTTVEVSPEPLPEPPVESVPEETIIIEGELPPDPPPDAPPPPP